MNVSPIKSCRVAQPSFHLFCHGFNSLLQNWQPHKIKPLNIALLKILSSYYDHLILKSPGNYLKKSPKALANTVVFVLLVNKDKEQLLRDYDILIELEKAATSFKDSYD